MLLSSMSMNMSKDTGAMLDIGTTLSAMLKKWKHVFYMWKFKKN